VTTASYLFLKAVQKVPLLRDNVDPIELREILYKFIDTSLTPEKMAARAVENIGQNVEVEQEQEQEQQQEMQVEVQELLLPPEKPYWRHLPWKQRAGAFNPNVYQRTRTIKTHRKATGKLSTLAKPISYVLRRTLGSLSKLHYGKKTLDAIASLALQGISYTTEFIERQVYQYGYFVDVSEFVASDPTLQTLSKIWSPNLKISHNIATLKALGLNARIAKPFDSMQKSSQLTLIKVNRNTGEWEVDIIDQKDAEFFQEQLRIYQGLKAQADIDIVLYDLALGVIQQGPGTLTEEEVRASSAVRQLIVEAKFFGGITHYTPEEKETLHAWIQHHGADQMREYFNNVITRYRSDRAQLIEQMKSYW